MNHVSVRGYTGWCGNALGVREDLEDTIRTNYHQEEGSYVDFPVSGSDVYSVIGYKVLTSTQGSEQGI